MTTSILTISAFILVILVFILFAYTDLAMLVRRPHRGLGTGFSRIWSVAHTTLLEAWSGRVWLLPIFWLIAALVLILVVRPYDPSERIPLDIRMLLLSQEILVLLLVGTMACLSLPRERERKIIITNASKPLSRLEILLGKMLGFSLTAFFLLAVLSILSYVILVGADYKVRADALREYQLAEYDFKNKTNPDKPENARPDLAPPKPLPLDKKHLAEDGSLFANNYVTPDRNASVVGGVKNDANGAVRYIKTGSEEKLVFQFGRIEADANADAYPQGQRPCFFFDFSEFQPYVGEIPPGFLIQVSARRLQGTDTQREQEQRFFLTPANGFKAQWEPPQPLELFNSPTDPAPRRPKLPVVEVSVGFPDIPGFMVKVREGNAGSNPSCYALPRIIDGKPTNLGYAPNPNPIVRSFEKYDKVQIAGPTAREVAAYGDQVPIETAIFRFHPGELKRVPVQNGKFNLSFILDVDKQDNQFADCKAIVHAYNDSAPAVLEQATVTVNEKRATVVTLPASLLGDPSKKNAADLVVLLQSGTQGHWLGFGPGSVRIEQPPSFFFINLLKAEAVIFFEVTLLIVIGVATSVRLGWPVAMLLTGCCYLLGHFREFITMTAQAGGLGALGYMPSGNESKLFVMFDYATSFLWNMLQLLIYILPDFTRFRSADFIADLRNIPWYNLSLNAGWTILYSLPFIALGYLLFRKQELG